MLGDGALVAAPVLQMLEDVAFGEHMQPFHDLQCHLAVAGANERKVKAGKVVDDSVARAQEAIDQSVAAQKTVLEFSTKQTKAAFEAAKKQFGYAGTPAAQAADSVQRGFEVVVDAQK